MKESNFQYFLLCKLFANLFFIVDFFFFFTLRQVRCSTVWRYIQRIVWKSFLFFRHILLITIEQVTLLVTQMFWENKTLQKKEKINRKENGRTLISSILNTENVAMSTSTLPVWYIV